MPLSPLHIETPLLRTAADYSASGLPLWLKLDALQPSGSFKLRGVGLLCQHEVAKGAKEIFCASGGNAGIAAAVAGKALGVPVTIVVPETTSAEVRARIAARLAHEGAVLANIVHRTPGTVAADARFGPGCVIDLSDTRDFQNTPEWTGSISANYNWVMENGSSIAFIPSIAYRGAYQQFETPAPLLDQDAYWMYDASIVWTSSDDRLTFGVHGKNLGDERYRVGGYTFPGATFINSLIGYYGPPQTVTASLKVSF